MRSACAMRSRTAIAAGIVHWLWHCPRILSIGRASINLCSKRNHCRLIRAHKTYNKPNPNCLAAVSNLLISRSLLAATFGCHELSLRAGCHYAGDYKGNTGCSQNWCLRSTAYQGQLQHRQSDHINECPPAEQVEAKVHNEHVPGQPDDAGAAGTGATVVCAIHQCQYNRLLVIAVRNETKKKQTIYLNFIFECVNPLAGTLLTFF